VTASIALRDDFDGPTPRRLTKNSAGANQTRRLLALAVVYYGDWRSAAAELGGVTLQIVRDWAVRFNAKGPDGGRAGG
jgi:transposase